MFVLSMLMFVMLGLGLVLRHGWFGLGHGLLLLRHGLLLGLVLGRWLVLGHGLLTFVFLFLFVRHCAPFLAKNYMAWTDEVRIELSACGIGKAVPDCSVPGVQTALEPARQGRMGFMGWRCEIAEGVSPA